MSVAGVTVTPAGNPLAATATVPLKPLLADARTATCCPEPPTATITALWVADNVKCAAVVARVRVAVWLSDPDVLVTEIVLEALATEPDAVSVKAWLPPATTDAIAGAAVTPAGKPESVTAVVPVKPLVPASVTEKLALPLALIVKEGTLRLSEKSPGIPVPLLLQPEARRRPKVRTRPNNRKARMRAKLRGR